MYYKLVFRILKNGFGHGHQIFHTKSNDPKEYGLTDAKQHLQDQLMAVEKARYAVILESKEAVTKDEYAATTEK